MTEPTQRAAIDTSALVGELLPGQSGWLAIDADGNPAGTATLLPPPIGTPACSVMRGPDPVPIGHDALTTLAGAPLVAPLNPSSDRRFGDAPPPPPEGTLSAASGMKAQPVQPQSMSPPKESSKK